MVTSRLPWSSYLLEAQDSEALKPTQTDRAGEKCCSTEIINQGFNNASFFFLNILPYFLCAATMQLGVISTSSFSRLQTDYNHNPSGVDGVCSLVTLSMLHPC